MSVTMIFENQKAVGTDTESTVAPTLGENIPRAGGPALTKVVDEKVVAESLMLREGHLHVDTLFREHSEQCGTYDLDGVAPRDIDPTNTRITPVPAFLAHGELGRSQNDLVARD